MIFEDRESSFEDQVSSFETLAEFFEDLEPRFRGNDLILEEKTIAMNKAIDVPFECMQIFFRVVHFPQDKCGSLICTEAIFAFVTLPAGPSDYFLRDYNLERVCCFHLCDFNRPSRSI